MSKDGYSIVCIMMCMHEQRWLQHLVLVKCVLYNLEHAADWETVVVLPFLGRRRMRGRLQSPSCGPVVLPHCHSKNENNKKHKHNETHNKAKSKHAKNNEKISPPKTEPRHELFEL